jgi:hypothetical protein
MVGSVVWAKAGDAARSAKDRRVRGSILTPWIGEIVLGRGLKMLRLCGGWWVMLRFIKRNGGSGGRDEKRIVRDHPV